MSSFESRFERLELKYLIDEATAERVRQDIEPFCHADAHNPRAHSLAARPGAARGYPISSLYLDSPNLAFYQAKERGDSERIKLRVRGYGDAPYAILECKRRVADVIDKTRVTVDRKDIERASQGFVDPGSDHPEAQRFLADFARLVASAGAEPTLLLYYEREAYVSEVDHYARVTFDRHIEAHRTSEWTLRRQGEAPCRFDDHWRRDDDHRSVVLELKCHSCIPWWMTDLIRKHALRRQSFSKYSIGVHLTGIEQGEDRITRRSARWMQ